MTSSTCQPLTGPGTAAVVTANDPASCLHRPRGRARTAGCILKTTRAMNKRSELTRQLVIAASSQLATTDFHHHHCVTQPVQPLAQTIYTSPPTTTRTHHTTLTTVNHHATLLTENHSPNSLSASATPITITTSPSTFPDVHSWDCQIGARRRPSGLRLVHSSTTTKSAASSTRRPVNLTPNIHRSSLPVTIFLLGIFFSTCTPVLSLRMRGAQRSSVDIADVVFHSQNHHQHSRRAIGKNSAEPHRWRRDLPPPDAHVSSSSSNDDGHPAGTGAAYDDILEDPDGQATASFTQAKIDKLKDHIERLRSTECRDIPSVATAVVTADGGSWSWGTGMANIEGNVKATVDTKYCLASLSKAFTATLLARLLATQGKSLDDTVMSILGDEYPFMEEYVSNHVTIRDLLLHRTGLPRYEYLWISSPGGQKNIFKRLRCMKHQAAFRTDAIYNNIMYALAGHVAEKLGGPDASWEQLMRSELLGPLDMRHTTTIHSIYRDGDNTTTAGKYSWINGTNVNTGDPIYKGASDIAAAIGMYSTASDMARWLKFQLSGKNQNGHNLIPKSLLKDMHRGQVTIDKMLKPEDIMSKDGSTVLNYNMYGLGWFTGTQRGHKLVMHYGSYPGSYSMITLVPDKGFAIFSVINGGIMKSPYSINSNIHMYAVDLLLGAQDETTARISNDFCKVNRAKMMEGPEDCSKQIGQYNIPPRHLDKYLGTFSNPAYGNVTVVQDGDVIYMRYNDLLFTASPIEDFRFCVLPTEQSQKAVFFPQTIEFGRNEYRDIAHISLSFLPKEDNVFYRLPEKVRYDDWLDEHCGGSAASRCGKIEQLPATQSAAVASHIPPTELFHLVFIYAVRLAL